MSPGARPAGVLSVLVNNLDGVFQRSVLQGAGEATAARGLSLAVRPLAGLSVRALRELVAEVTRRSAGVLVLANALPDAELATLAASGVPVTLVSHHAPELALPSVMFDNAQGVALLTKHVVVERARRSLVFVGGDPAQLDAREREAAFRDEAVRHGLDLPADYYLRGDFTPTMARDSLTRFLARGGACDAVVAADYLMAIAAVSALRAAGRSVPADVAVVGFGDGPEAEAAGVTTVAADVVELGRRAVRQLAAQLTGRRLSGRTLLSTHLVPRDTSE